MCRAVVIIAVDLRFLYACKAFWQMRLDADYPCTVSCCSNNSSIATIPLFFEGLCCKRDLTWLCMQTHAYACHDSFICALWLIRRGVFHLRHDPLAVMRSMTHESFIRVTWHRLFTQLHGLLLLLSLSLCCSLTHSHTTANTNTDTPLSRPLPSTLPLSLFLPLAQPPHTMPLPEFSRC